MIGVSALTIVIRVSVDLFGIECCYSTKTLATATHPTLLWAPIFHEQEDEDNGFTFNARGLRRVFAS